MSVETMVGSAEPSAALLFPLTADIGSSATPTPPDTILPTISAVLVN